MSTKAKKSKKLPEIHDFIEEMSEESEFPEGKIEAILALWIKGYTCKDIVSAGYNKSTVYRQVGDYEKMKKAPMMSYYGHELYEGRIQRLMSAKKISRDKAVEMIAKADLA